VCRPWYGAAGRVFPVRGDGVGENPISLEYFQIVVDISGGGEQSARRVQQQRSDCHGF